MADGDAFMMEDDEDYDLEYDEESGSEPDVDLENQYYNSKALKEVDKNKSLESFKKVLELEGSSKGEWGFRALKQMLKLNFKMRRYEEMMKNYQALLTYMRSAVTRNYSEKSINSILEHISSSDNMTLLENFYNITLDALRDMKNERLWFKTNCKLGKLFFDRGEYQKVARITRQLHQSCQTAYGDDDQCKGTQLMEVYALEIQMHSAQKNSKALKKVYEQSLQVKSAIPHPLIMGGIRECGGKMHLREGQFQAAHTDFFEAFKNYDESGSQRRITCLKYLVLANLLMNSDINPFDSQEAKAYKNDPEIVAMTDLITAYQNHDIEEFEKILRKPANRLLNDEFIKEHVKMLLTNVRTEILRKIIQPYLSITLDFVASKLNTSVDEVHQLLKKSIIEGEINGLIDETTQTLFIDSGENSDIAWNNAYEPWLESLCSLQQAISTRIFA